MTPEIRQSGIAPVGPLPWGSHFCHFYETSQDLLDVLIPYFGQGLENHEFCMWIIYDPLTEDQARRALVEGVPDGSRYLEAANIEIMRYSDWYLVDGVFDPTRVIAAWKARLAQALGAGYVGMRVNGDEAWLTDRTWRDFKQYEEQLNETLTGLRMIVLCTFPLPETSGSQVFDLAKTHQFTVAKRFGEWEVLESPELRRAKNELEALSRDLETRVAERTDELNAANAKLREISASLEAVREAEGTRISREIHDQVGSALTSLRWDLEELERGILPANQDLDAPSLKRKIDAMIERTNDTIQTVRRVASELRPSMLDDLGLLDAVEWQLKDFEKRTGIQCWYHCSLIYAGTGSDQSTALFRILQEALTNVLRHASATRVDVTIEKIEGNLVLTILDNGRGLPDEQPSRAESLGILGMHERARLAGGTLRIDSADGHGVSVSVTVPLESKQTHETPTSD